MEFCFSCFPHENDNTKTVGIYLLNHSCVVLNCAILDVSLGLS